MRLSCSGSQVRTQVVSYLTWKTITNGTNRLPSVGYRTGLRFLSSATWPSMSKKRYNGLIDQSINLCQYQEFPVFLFWHASTGQHHVFKSPVMRTANTKTAAKRINSSQVITICSSMEMTVKMIYIVNNLYTHDMGKWKSKKS